MAALSVLPTEKSLRRADRVRAAYDALTLETAKLQALAEILASDPAGKHADTLACMIVDLVAVVNTRADALADAVTS